MIDYPVAITVVGIAFSASLTIIKIYSINTKNGNGNYADMGSDDKTAKPTLNFGNRLTVLETQNTHIWDSLKRLEKGMGMLGEKIDNVVSNFVKHMSRNEK